MKQTALNQRHYEHAIATIASRIPAARLERLQDDDLDLRGYLPEFTAGGARAHVYRHKTTGGRLLYSPRLGTFRILEE
jgi:hypothetical protein